MASRHAVRAATVVVDPHSLRLLRRAHNLRQIDVARTMVPPVSRQRLDQFERRRDGQLSPDQFHRVAAAIVAAAQSMP